MKTKMGFSEFDTTLIGKISSEIIFPVTEDIAIKLISSMENVGVSYLTSLFNSYKRLSRI